MGLTPRICLWWVQIHLRYRAEGSPSLGCWPSCGARSASMKGSTEEAVVLLCLLIVTVLLCRCTVTCATRPEAADDGGVCPAVRPPAPASKPAMRKLTEALPAVPAAPPVGLLSLSDDLLVHILRRAAPKPTESQLLYVVPLVCRRLAAVARLPSELWAEQLIALNRCLPYKSQCGPTVMGAR